MTTLELNLRFGPAAVRPPRAWYLPGGDAAAWLERIAAWEVAASTLRMLPLPRGRDDRRAAGLLVTFHADALRTMPAGCVPFGLIAGRLYLPVEAGFDPEVSEAELDALLAEDYIHVWHPAIGLVALEPHEALRAGDLLTAPPRSARRWDHALPGVAFAQRLVSLAPARELTMQVLLEEGRDDIGRDSGSLDELPRSPAEPQPGSLRAASRLATRLVAGIVGGLARLAPSNARAPTWINRLQDWAERQLGKLAAGYNAARHKEIERLMHLLTTDPDQGLRYALPMGGEGHRGLAAGGDRLIGRDTNFDLGRLGGGRPADFWDVAPNYQVQLAARYRELANRELHLGRHRRAAYIYAELLGDYQNAAGALAAGRHWREAAALYRQRLHRPREAARCLEQGGLWTEAIALYEELGEHETAGDLYARLGQRESADGQYRTAVIRCRQGGDLISAARLLDEKLFAADEAIAELSSGWPDSSQAAPCLRGVFRLLGRLGRHEDARRWIDELRGGQAPPAVQVPLVEIVADLAGDYPDASLRLHAADSVRVLTSPRLLSSTETERRRLLDAIARLAPEDQLLRRDCQRYQPPLPPPPLAKWPAHAGVSKSPRRGRPRLVHSFSLVANAVQWRAAAGSGKEFFAAGILDDRLVLVRSAWQACERPGKTWTISHGLEDAPILLAVDPTKDEFVGVHVVGGDVLSREHVFEPTHACPRAMRAGPPRGITLDGVAAAMHDGATWLIEGARSGLHLAAVGRHGEPISTRLLPPPPVTVDEYELGEEDELPHIPVPLHLRGRNAYIGIGKSLLVLGPEMETETITLGRQIRGLTGSRPNTRPRIVATFDRGGAVYWDEFGDCRIESFAQDMADPVAGVTRGGCLVAASEGTCQVYATQNKVLLFEAEFDLPRDRPLAVLSAPRGDQFGIVFASGAVQVYELA